MKFICIPLLIVALFTLKPIVVLSLSIVQRIEERIVQIAKQEIADQSTTKAELIKEDDHQEQYGLSSNYAIQSLSDQNWYKNPSLHQAKTSHQKRCCGGGWFMGQKSKRCSSTKPLFGGSTNGYIVATIGKRQCGGEQ
uniref:Secreted protein n=1 Tax=Romanomermis culicivorax TaxID=13658 RepID=A0A915HP26_ROMCU